MFNYDEMHYNPVSQNLPSWVGNDTQWSIIFHSHSQVLEVIFHSQFFAILLQQRHQTRMHNLHTLWSYIHGTRMWPVTILCKSLTLFLIVFPGIFITKETGRPWGLHPQSCACCFRFKLEAHHPHLLPANQARPLYLQQLYVLWQDISIIKQLTLILCMWCFTFSTSVCVWWIWKTTEINSCVKALSLLWKDGM